MTGGCIEGRVKRDEAAETAAEENGVMAILEAEEKAALTILEALMACDSILFVGLSFRTLGRGVAKTSRDRGGAWARLF